MAAAREDAATAAALKEAASIRAMPECPEHYHQYNSRKIPSDTAEEAEIADLPNGTHCYASPDHRAREESRLPACQAYANNGMRWVAVICPPPKDEAFSNNTSLVDPNTIHNTTWELCGYDGVLVELKDVRPLECRLNPQTRKFEWRYGKGHHLTKTLARMHRVDAEDWANNHPISHYCGGAT